MEIAFFKSETNSLKKTKQIKQDRILINFFDMSNLSAYNYLNLYLR